ncbi:WbqC family protein [Ferrovibrio xuzhouensis]|uniref:WbqC family protein n=1 Tax=Ferrovibrio xuzhouensis TaxID=1576914 RepID=A0ABV7VLJ5_9PROT
MTYTVVIHQPDFAPYLGFFHRFLHADLYVVLDHVQFVTNTSRSWTHRDKIRAATGEKWLTLGVKKPPLGTPINQVALAGDATWVANNLGLLRENYSRATGWSEVMPIIEDLYQNPPASMQMFNMRWLERLADLLEVRIPFVLSSSLLPQGQKNEMLVDLLQKVGATHYLSGTGARAYMDTEVFTRAGIEVVWQQFEHPVYPQQYEPFIPYLSILDVLFNCGVAGTRALLRSCR